MAQGKPKRSARRPGRKRTFAVDGLQRKVVDGADINIIVRREDKGFGAIASAPYPELYDIRISDEELFGRHRRLVGQAAEALASGEADDLALLAHLGHELYLRLVAPQSVRDAIEDASRAQDGPEPAEPLRIDLTSNEFHFPWELLYIGDPDAEILPEKFLGIAHILTRVPLTKPNFIEQRPRALSRPIPRLAHASHVSLSHAVRYEVPRLKSLGLGRTGLNRADVHELGAFDGRKRHAACTLLRDRIHGIEADILHMACHGNVGEGEHPGCFEIDQDFSVESDVFAKNGFTMPGSPVVFLNACEMGMASPIRFHSFLNVLFDADARAILAPGCEIGDRPATYFANAFYKFFVRRHHTIAHAVWLAKRERLSRGDLSGLVYVLFGQPEAVVEARSAA